jgi:hypothetical protein
MGWVKENLASDGETVEGLIIAQDLDDKLRCALTVTRSIQFMQYEVSFKLRNPYR